MRYAPKSKTKTQTKPTTITLGDMAKQLEVLIERYGDKMKVVTTRDEFDGRGYTATEALATKVLARVIRDNQDNLVGVRVLLA